MEKFRQEAPEKSLGGGPSTTKPGAPTIPNHHRRAATRGAMGQWGGSGHAAPERPDNTRRYKRAALVNPRSWPSRGKKNQSFSS